MGRPVVLSNGRLFVGLNEHGLVHDFYYPYVGLENLSNARLSEHKIGVWVDGAFSWIDDSWHITMQFEKDALASNISMQSDELAVSLHFTDFVDEKDDVFIRKVTITNEADHQREIRLFMHQVFQISSQGRADTGLYVPDDHYILDFKGRSCLLIGGALDKTGDFDQFAVGSYGIEGKSGTFKDAEDGELSGNLVEHGGVDSVIRFAKQVEAGASFQVDYWIVAGRSQNDVAATHANLAYQGVDHKLEHTRKHYQQWLAPAQQKLSGVSTEDKQAITTSLLIIKAHCDARGSVLASGDSSIFNYGRDYYCYCWPRDAAYALWPLIRLGLYDEAKHFFAFARDTMHPDGYLMHKYQPDRAIGSTWHPLKHGRSKELAIQEDETASVLYMMGEYYQASKDAHFIESYYESFIVKAANFLAEFYDEATELPHASYDLWEQKFLTSTYTVTTVIAALETAAGLARTLDDDSHAVKWQQRADLFRSNLKLLFSPEGYYRKGYLLQSDGDIQHDDVIDISSLYGPFMFTRAKQSDEMVEKTSQAVEKALLNTGQIGGVIRYTDDGYFRAGDDQPSNPWIVCTMWLAQYYIFQNREAEARQLVDWALTRRNASGVLSEQYAPGDGAPLGVAPLVWSHAELINTLLDLHKI